jgi:hypothetical protein
VHLGRSGTGLRCERTHWEFEAMTGKALLFPVVLGWLPPLRAAAQNATDMAVSGVPGAHGSSVLQRKEHQNMNPPWHRAGHGSRTTLQLRGVYDQFWIKFASHSPLGALRANQRALPRTEARQGFSVLRTRGVAVRWPSSFAPTCSGSNVYLR